MTKASAHLSATARGGYYIWFRGQHQEKGCEPLLQNKIHTMASRYQKVKVNYYIQVTVATAGYGRGAAVDTLKMDMT